MVCNSIMVSMAVILSCVIYIDKDRSGTYGALVVMPSMEKEAVMLGFASHDDADAWAQGQVVNMNGGPRMA